MDDAQPQDTKRYLAIKIMIVVMLVSFPIVGFAAGYQYHAVTTTRPANTQVSKPASATLTDTPTSSPSTIPTVPQETESIMKKFVSQEGGFEFEYPKEYRALMCPPYYPPTATQSPALFPKGTLHIDFSSRFACGNELKLADVVRHGDISITIITENEMKENLARAQNAYRHITRSVLPSDNKTPVTHIYNDWCEGFPRDNFTNLCLPTAPSANFIYIERKNQTINSDYPYIEVIYWDTEIGSKTETYLESLLSSFILVR